MTTFNGKGHIIGTAEYSTNFWNVMRGGGYAIDNINDGKDVSARGYALSSAADDKLRKVIKRTNACSVIWQRS